MADMVPVQIPAGLCTDSSGATIPGRWFDVNMVRWVNGGMQPWGGWELQSYAEPASPVRLMHTWMDNNGIVRTAVLCESNLYLLDGGVLVDISPAAAMTGPSADLLAGGYGDDVYSLNTYGTARPNKPAKAIGPVFTLDNWGQNLVAMSSYDGRLLMWDPLSAPGTKAAAVTNAPTNNRTFVVTPERMVVLFAASNIPNRVQWCNAEDITSWTPGITSTAGSYDISPASPIVSAKLISTGIVFFTVKNSFILRSAGLPFVYTYDTLSGGSPPLNGNSIGQFKGKAVWLADDGFWQCDGNTVESVPCEIFDWIKNNINNQYSRFKVSCMELGTYSELWWMIPMDGSPKNNVIIIWNHVNGWFSRGSINRTCGVPSSYTTYPILSDGTRFFQHESGVRYYDYTDLPYAECSFINADKGASNIVLDQMICDHGGPPEMVKYTFKGWDSRARQDIAPTATRGPMVASARGWLDPRIPGRDISIRIQSYDNGVGLWTFGAPLINVIRKGKGK